MRAPSQVSVLTREMTLNANQTEAFPWLAAHEFGHVPGLKDRYSESIISSADGWPKAHISASQPHLLLGPRGNA